MSAVGADCRITPFRVVRAEWSKLWTLRSTWYALGGCVVLTAVVGVVIAVSAGDGPRGPSDPVELSLFGLNFAQLVLPILGVLVTAGEYSTGMIRASMTAVPRRLPVLWSKAAVFGAVVFGTVLVTAFGVFGLAQLFLSGTALAASYGDPGVLRALFGSAAVLALLGVLGLALGALTRGVPAGIGAFVVLLTVLPQLAGTLPYEWVDTVVRCTPLPAGQGLMAALPQPDSLSPLTGLATLTAWTAAALGAAGLLLKRRDV
ncbi:ABC transporter permease [Streptomyces iconiensis]|uniref:ABC transporter permease n=1 Tax=Streptomyces iconiensis TaxID=1384038 RepID=A0ABT6ZZU9_9ACTN|nr:ABC transporter permease [Streptomyces iconiensis]MDJ1134581.1 ABC transporter permease [Streptomyces iconiensis]